MNVFIIVLMVVFFIYLIFCTELYLTWCVHREHRYEKKLRRHDNFKLEIQSQLEAIKNNQPLSPTQLKRVLSLLKRQVYFDLFNEVIIETYQSEDYRPVIRQYMNYFDKLLERLIKKKLGANDLFKLKLSKLIGYYQVDSPQVHLFLLNCLKQNSMYLKLNVLMSLSQIGNVTSFYDALCYISKEYVLYNEKLLIDIMAKFTGDQTRLNNQLLEYFSEFTKEFQITLIHYFTLKSWQPIEPLLLDLLERGEEKEKELHLGAIKYFTNYPSSMTKSLFLHYLKHADWEYRALSAKALQHFSQDDVINHLFAASRDRNWYVRFNSAMTLCSYHIDEKILSYIEHTEDHYSKDILLYALSLKQQAS